MPGGAAATKRARTKAKARAKVRKAAALPSTYVVDLPDAVWHNIFAPFSEKTIRGADYITLRALVLVNKAFNALATPYLYATVDAPVFDTLLAYPKYAAMVKSVYPYQSKETWWQIANIIAEAVGKSVDELPSKWRPTPGESKEPGDQDQFKKLAALLPTLTALEELELNALDEDLAWISLIPNPVTGVASTTGSGLPAGLHNLRSIELSAKRSAAVGPELNVAMLLPLFFLPSIRKLEFTHVTQPRGGLGKARLERVRALAGKSPVGEIAFNEDSLDMVTTLALLGLPTALVAVHLDSSAEDALSALSDVLERHTSTLQHLYLGNATCDDTPRTDVLRSLHGFPALRRLEVETNQLLSIADRAGSLARLLPPNLVHLELALNNTDKRARRATLAKQMLEVVRTCEKLRILKIMGDDLDDIADRLEDECEERDIDFDRELWPGPME